MGSELLNELGLVLRGVHKCDNSPPIPNLTMCQKH